MSAEARLRAAQERLNSLESASEAFADAAYHLGQAGEPERRGVALAQRSIVNDLAAEVTAEMPALERGVQLERAAELARMDREYERSV